MRYAGFKGVLVEDPRCHGAVFRESMKKFNGNLDELGVIRISTYSFPYLNR
jgi:hypothetical protein